MTRGAGRKRNVPRQPVPGDPEGAEIGLSILQDPAGSPIPGLTGNIINHETVRQPVPVADETFDEYRGMMAHGVPNDSQSTEERALMERDGTLAQHNPPTAPERSSPIVRPPAIPVYLVEQGGGSHPVTTLAGQKISIPPKGTEAARIGSRDITRTDFYVMAEVVTVNGANPAPSQPAVPATGVAQQNANSYPVSVVIGANGATITNVSVNGITVGAAAGTYAVPAFGSISIAYAVATPTWVWSYAGAQVTTTAAGIRISHEVGDLDVGLGALIEPGAYQRLNKFQDELFAVSADANPQTVSIITLFEIPAGA
jgi:hypothetical protein